MAQMQSTNQINKNNTKKSTINNEKMQLYYDSIDCCIEKDYLTSTHADVICTLHKKEAKILIYNVSLT